MSSSTLPPPAPGSREVAIESFEHPGTLRILTARFSASALVGVDVELKSECVAAEDPGLWSAPRLSVYGFHRIPAAEAERAAAALGQAIAAALREWSKRFG
jgi:hypothetical protein